MHDLSKNSIEHRNVDPVLSGPSVATNRCDLLVSVRSDPARVG